MISSPSSIDPASASTAAQARAVVVGPAAITADPPCSAWRQQLSDRSGERLAPEEHDERAVTSPPTGRRSNSRAASSSER